MTTLLQRTENGRRGGGKKKPIYTVADGPDYSHRRLECTVFDLLREAREYVATLQDGRHYEITRIGAKKNAIIESGIKGHERMRPAEIKPGMPLDALHATLKRQWQEHQYGDIIKTIKRARPGLTAGGNAEGAEPIVVLFFDQAITRGGKNRAV